MRTSAIIRIVTSLLLIVFLVFILTNSLGKNQFSFNGFKLFSINLGGFNYKFDDESKYSIADGKITVDDVRKIDLDWISGNIKIEEYNGNKIEFYEENSSSLSEDDKMRYFVDNGTLKIRFRKSYMGFGLLKSLNKAIVLRIPVSMEDGLNEFKIDNVSSSINIEALITDNLTIDSVSGEISIRNLLAKELDIETVSGTVNVSAKSEILNIETVSGTLNAVIDSALIKKVNVDSVSGDAFLDLGSCPEDLDMESVSGNAHITIPENKGFEVKYDTVSGKFKCDFAVSITKKEAVYKEGNSGNSKLRINTVSGNININKK